MKITLVIILTSIINVQGQVTFQKLFGDPQSNVSEYVHDACVDAWGNLYVTGANNLNTFNLAKVDSIGTICWHKTLSAFYAEGMNILFSSDSNIMVTGRSGTSPQNSFIFILKVDTAGTVLWSSFLPLDTLGGLVNFLIEDQQGNFLVGGYNVNFDSQTIVRKSNLILFYLPYKN